MRLLNSTMNWDRNLSTWKEREIDFKNSPLFSMDPKHLRLNSLRDKTDIGVFDRGAFKSSQRVIEMSNLYRKEVLLKHQYLMLYDLRVQMVCPTFFSYHRLIISIIFFVLHCIKFYNICFGSIVLCINLIIDKAIENFKLLFMKLQLWQIKILTLNSYYSKGNFTLICNINFSKI